MIKRKIIASVFIILALVLGGIFFLQIAFPNELQGYFKSEYYSQFGPLAICIELLVAGMYLFIKHPKANFALALIGFTAILDPIFNLVGLFTSLVPIYAMILLVAAALVSLWLAFTNTFNLGRISFIGALASFAMGTAIELFFNYI
jgi:hypothetical protein